MPSASPYLPPPLLPVFLPVLLFICFSFFPKPSFPVVAPCLLFLPVRYFLFVFPAIVSHLLDLSFFSFPPPFLLTFPFLWLIFIFVFPLIPVASFPCSFPQSLIPLLILFYLTSFLLFHPTSHPCCTVCLSLLSCCFYRPWFFLSCLEVSVSVVLLVSSFLLSFFPPPLRGGV